MKKTTTISLAVVAQKGPWVDSGSVRCLSASPRPSGPSRALFAALGAVFWGGHHRQRPWALALWALGAAASVLLAPLSASASSGSDEYPYVYKSPRLLGQGQAGGVAEPRDEESLFFNPAGLARRRDEEEAGFRRTLLIVSPLVEVSRSTIKLAEKIQAGDTPITDIIAGERGTPQHVAAYNFTGAIFSNFAMGVFQEASTTAIFTKSQEFRGIEALSLDAEAGKGIILGFGRELSTSLSMGLSLSYLDRQEIHTQMSVIDLGSDLYQKKSPLLRQDLMEEGQGTAASVGWLWRRRDLATSPSLGLTVNNLGDTAMGHSVSSGGKGIARNQKQAVNLGGAFSPFDSPWIRAYGDFDDLLGRVDNDVIKRTHFGASLKLGPVLGLSGGLNQGYPAAGAYADTRLFRVDAGAYSEEVGEWAGRRQDSRVYARLTVGF